MALRRLLASGSLGEAWRMRRREARAASDWPRATRSRACWMRGWLIDGEDRGNSRRGAISRSSRPPFRICPETDATLDGVVRTPVTDHGEEPVSQQLGKRHATPDYL